MANPHDAAVIAETAALQEVAAKSDQEARLIIGAGIVENLTKEALLFGGQAQAFAYIETFGRVAAIVKLKQIKETGAYKGCGDGTWESFCSGLGFTRRKIDIDITNLETFGSEFLESANRLGLGYRDLANMRALPEDARLQITDGRVVNLEEASKSDIRLLIEDMATRNSTEKRRLVEEATDVTRKLKKTEAELETAEATKKQLKTQVETLKSGLGETEREALKRLLKIKTNITGGINLIRASDPELGTAVGAEIQGVLAYFGDLARLAALEVGLNFNDGTTPAEVAAAQGEFDSQWGGGSEGKS